MKTFISGERIIDDSGCSGTIIESKSIEHNQFIGAIYNVSHDLDYSGHKTNTDGWYTPDKLTSIEKFVPVESNSSLLRPFSIGYKKDGINQLLIVMAHSAKDAYLYFAVNEGYDQIFSATALPTFLYENYIERGMPEIIIDYNKEFQMDKEHENDVLDI